MNFIEFIDEYAKKNGISRVLAEETCAKVFSQLYNCVRKDRVYIPKVGSFAKMRERNNPADEGKIQVLNTDVGFIPYDPIANSVPDPMVPDEKPKEKALKTPLWKEVEDSVNMLGEKEFRRRMVIMRDATKYDVSLLKQKEVTRRKKLICPCCGKEFTPRFAHQRFCCTFCREENARRARTEFSAFEHDARKLSPNLARSVTINL